MINHVWLNEIKYVPWLDEGQNNIKQIKKNIKFSERKWVIQKKGFAFHWFTI